MTFIRKKLTTVAELGLLSHGLHVVPMHVVVSVGEVPVSDQSA